MPLLAMLQEARQPPQSEIAEQERSGADHRRAQDFGPAQARCQARPPDHRGERGDGIGEQQVDHGERRGQPSPQAAREGEAGQQHHDDDVEPHIVRFIGAAVPPL